MSQSLIGMIPPGGAWGGGSPPNVSTPFLPGRRHSSGSGAPPKGSTLDNLNRAAAAVAAAAAVGGAKKLLR